MNKENKIVILGGPSSIGKSTISKVLKDKYKINSIHKRDLDLYEGQEINLLETHYSFNEADRKYSEKIIPTKEDFFSQPFPNLNLDFLKNFNNKDFFNFVCFYANPETIFQRAKKRFEDSGRKPRSLDKEIIQFETESEIKMGNKIKNTIGKIYSSNFISIDTEGVSPEDLAENLYSKFFY